MSRRPTYSIDEIKHMLLDRVGDVARQYAPPAQGSYEHKGLYFTLNPWRADRSVGSFYIHVGGAKIGKWRDHATGEYGDILDLIQKSLHTDATGAIKEARAYLGLETLSPDGRRKREQAAERARQQRLAAERHAREDAERRRKHAHALWLSGQAPITDTPVEMYLRDRRGLDLRCLGHQPGALRYVPKLKHSSIDRETGEVFEGEWPAMVSVIVNAKGEPLACHRTWLDLAADGLVDKAPVAKPKMVLGDYGGGFISVWKGRGPRGGKAPTIANCPPGTHVFMSEGVEDALTAVMIDPDLRVLAAISLDNMGLVQLPNTVSNITLIADNDLHIDAQNALDRAVGLHQKAGRHVRVWHAEAPHKDLNDAWRAQQSARGAA